MGFESRSPATGELLAARIYRGTVDVAAICIWLRDPVHDLRDTP